MVVCTSEEAQRMGELHGLRSIGSVVASGSRLAAGETILTLEGPASGLHKVWKMAQTFREYLSGIASSTAEIVAAARSANPDRRSRRHKFNQCSGIRAGRGRYPCHLRTVLRAATRCSRYTHSFLTP